MKSGRFGLIVLLIFGVILSTCKKDEGITICGSRCSSATPWKVESLDLGLPCFATKQECIDWAASHGYGGGNCVQCD